MDTGYIPQEIFINMMQQEPEVISATAIKHSEGIDRTMKAELSFQMVPGEYTLPDLGQALLSVFCKSSDRRNDFVENLLYLVSVYHISMNLYGKTTERFVPIPMGYHYFVPRCNAMKYI